MRCMEPFTVWLLVVFLPWSLELPLDKSADEQNINEWFGSKLITACSAVKNHSNTKKSNVKVESMSRVEESLNHAESWHDSTRRSKVETMSSAVESLNHSENLHDNKRRTKVETMSSAVESLNHSENLHDNKRRTKVESMSSAEESSNDSENLHESTTKSEVEIFASHLDFYMKKIMNQLSSINEGLVTNHQLARMVLRDNNEESDEDDKNENDRKIDYNAIATDCESLTNTDLPSGIYQLSRDFLRKMDWIWNVFEVYCDQSVGGGWTVIQRRGGPSAGLVDFAKSWDDYAKGFGDLSGEFWLGNEWIYRLTTLFGPYELRIELEDWDGEKAWAQYSEFAIYRKDENYQLLFGGHTGNATDSLGGRDSFNYNNYFSTYDHRQDHTANFKLCSSTMDGGWWYNRNCPFTNLNGQFYKKGQDRKPRTGIVWEGWHDDSSLKSTKMMIRSKYYRSLNTANRKTPQCQSH